MACPIPLVAPVTMATFLWGDPLMLRKKEGGKEESQGLASDTVNEQD